MKRLQVTRAAERDLDEIWLYIARDSLETANRVVDELSARFALISSHPKMGHARDHLKTGLRSHAVGNFVIYYREMRARVSILHIVHAARDPNRLFKT